MSGSVSNEDVRDATTMGDATRTILHDGEPSAPDARTSEGASVTGTLPMIWVNGNRVASDAMHVSALDRGFTLADGIFETMLVRHGMVFRPERHLDRLRDGARVLRIELPYPIRDWLEEAAFRTGGALGMEAAAIRLTVSRRPGAHGLAPRGWGGATVVITGDALPEFPASLYEQGLSALTAGARRDERSLTAGVKTLAYTETIAALSRAHDEGADEVIFLDAEGHIAEASASNIFIAIEGALVTPPLSCGVLPGITREAIIECAAALDVQVMERPVDPSELTGADEAFLTSSLRGVAPLVRIDGSAIGSGSVGALTRTLSAAYSELVESECARARRRHGSMVR